MNGGDFPQCRQYRIHLKVPAERGQGGLAREKMLRRQPLQGGERGMDRFDTTAGPAQRPRQLDIRAQRIGRTLHGAGLFYLIDDRLDLVQRAREPHGKTIGE